MKLTKQQLCFLSGHVIAQINKQSLWEFAADFDYSIDTTSGRWSMDICVELDVTNEDGSYGVATFYFEYYANEAKQHETPNTITEAVDDFNGEFESFINSVRNEYNRTPEYIGGVSDDRFNAVDNLKRVA